MNAPLLSSILSSISRALPQALFKAHFKALFSAIFQALSHKNIDILHTVTGPTYIWTFNLRTKAKPSKWVLAGVAMLLQI